MFVHIPKAAGNSVKQLFVHGFLQQSPRGPGARERGKGDEPVTHLPGGGGKSAGAGGLGAFGSPAGAPKPAFGR